MNQRSNSVKPVMMSVSGYMLLLLLILPYIYETIKRIEENVCKYVFTLYTRKNSKSAAEHLKERLKSMAEERQIEMALQRQVKKRGGRAVKFTSPGLDGVPDRLVLMPGGRCAFVELKAPGKKLRTLQEKRRTQLEALGFPVYCIDRTEMIGGVLDEIQST